MPSRTSAKMRGDPPAGGEKGELELPISMIDVVFLLLIFFICTLQFKSVERKLNAELPKDGPDGIGDITQPTEIRLKIYWANARGQVIHKPGRPYPDIWDGATPRPGGRAPLSTDGAHVVMKVNQMRVPGTRRPDLNQLARTLEALAARNPEMPVVVNSRQAVPFKYVIGALDACARARVRNVKFQAPPAEGGGGSDWWWM